MTKTYVQTLSDVLRQNTMLSGNDSDITAFSDTQHQAAIQLAKIAIQSSLNQLVSESLIPFERTDGTITFVTDQRVYALPSDFMRFIGNKQSKPFMLQLDASEDSDNRYLYEYPGGLSKLEAVIPQYREDGGTPWYWYMIGGSALEVGFFHVPDLTMSGLKVRFAYEKEVMVNAEADLLPFTRVSQEIAFTDLASRYFAVIHSGAPIATVSQDPAYVAAKSTLIALMNHKPPSGKYGHIYL